MSGLLTGAPIKTAFGVEISTVRAFRWSVLQ